MWQLALAAIGIALKYTNHKCDLEHTYGLALLVWCAMTVDKLD